MQLKGILIGLISFLSIGLFHPLVIKGEYYFSKKIWPVFGIFGIFMLAVSLKVKNIVASAGAAVIGMSSFWSIKELYEQEQALKVYGKVYFCKSPGSLQKENVVRVLDKPSQAYRVFFLYYYDADRFVQLLAERTGKPVDRMSVCATSLQEVKNKGVF